MYGIEGELKRKPEKNMKLEVMGLFVLNCIDKKKGGEKQKRDSWC